MAKRISLRSHDKIGYFDVNNKDSKTNAAYRNYASLYLDYADDNLDHFFNRNIDVRPLENLKPEQWNEVETVYDAFVNAAIDLAKYAISMGERIEHITKHYPLMADYKDEILHIAKKEGDKIV